jgi:dTDP-4-dehydrorhamnose reductase
VHERLFADWAAGRTARLFTDEIRQPCTAENLADVLVELCERADLCGVFHWAGAEAVSRHELGLRIARHFGVPPAGRIEEARLADSPTASSRPADLALDLKPLVGRLTTRVQSLDEQLGSLRVPQAARSWWSALPK